MKKFAKNAINTNVGKPTVSKAKLEGWGSGRFWTIVFQCKRAPYWYEVQWLSEKTEQTRLTYSWDKKLNLERQYR